jgi:hypothetical protein
MKNLKQKLLVTTLALLGCISIDGYAKDNEQIPISAGSQIKNLETIQGRYYMLTSWHQANLSNPSLQRVTYTIDMEICGVTGCTVKTEIKTIEPGQTLNYAWVNSQWESSQYKGIFKTTAKTHIYGSYATEIINYAKVTVR